MLFRSTTELEKTKSDPFWKQSGDGYARIGQWACIMAMEEPPEVMSVHIRPLVSDPFAEFESLSVFPSL